MKRKHASRKATDEQVAAMNRELEVRNADFRYALQDGRLIRVSPTYYDWEKCFPVMQ